MSGIEKVQARWSSRWVFILAATGSAVGLGNIWKFPYMAGKNGGGMFVLVYLVCIALVGLPILMTEIMIGRKGRGSPVNAVRNLIRETGSRRAWAFLAVIDDSGGAGFSLFLCHGLEFCRIYPLTCGHAGLLACIQSQRSAI